MYLVDDLLIFIHYIVHTIVARTADSVRLIGLYRAGTDQVEKYEYGDIALCTLSMCRHYCYWQTACQK